ncbi:putative Cytochrome P450 oxidoreductase [Fonsecaea pedrosoi]|nr:putative Cytochrome P450 oxidoreductase [Fonsecaea pedrosoi]
MISTISQQSLLLFLPPLVILAACLLKLASLTSRWKGAPPAHDALEARRRDCLLEICTKYPKETYICSISDGVKSVSRPQSGAGDGPISHSLILSPAPTDGPIFSLKLGSQNVVVLTSGELIKRVVDKRSGNYSDRPKLYMQDIWEGSRIIMRGYDSLWKVERKLYHQFLNINKAARYVPYQDLETKQMLVDLLSDPDDFENLITRTTLSMATSMAYGFRVLDPKSEVMQELFTNTHGFFVMVNQSKLLDWYPQLRPLVSAMPSWLYPMARKAKHVFYRERAQFRQLYEAAKRAAEGDNSLPSFSTDISKAKESWKGTENGALLTDHAASYIAGIAMEGAADTTSNTLAGMIKAMMLFPSVQETAQKELDTVVGPDRLPTMDDFESLPYIRQVTKEALRWLPTAISGAIPHAALTDDEVDGYKIPAGCTIVLAVWSANNDPDLFPNPREFDPTRHNADLTFHEASSASDYRDRDNWTFGAGRRICPGIHVAEKTLFLATARLLWTFNICKARDDQGREIQVDRDEVTQSIAARPLPFPCQLTPRSDKCVRIARAEWKESQKLLDGEGNYKHSVLD